MTTPGPPSSPEGPVPQTLDLADAPTVTAPDGSTVRVLLALPGGSMARFELAPGQVAAAVRHRSVSELWYVLAGRGEMWRAHGDEALVEDLLPGRCLSVPVGTAFQFRAAPDQALAVVAVTLPPWPGDGEAQVVPGPWTPTDA